MDSKKKDNKLKRVTQACNYCKLKRIKCSGDNPCENCKINNNICEYSAAKKRGRKAKTYNSKYFGKFSDACNYLYSGVPIDIPLINNDSRYDILINYELLDIFFKYSTFELIPFINYSMINNRIYKKEIYFSLLFAIYGLAEVIKPYGDFSLAQKYKVISMQFIDLLRIKQQINDIQIIESLYIISHIDNGSLYDYFYTKCSLKIFLRNDIYNLNVLEYKDDEIGRKNYISQVYATVILKHMYSQINNCLIENIDLNEPKEEIHSNMLMYSDNISNISSTDATKTVDESINIYNNQRRHVLLNKIRKDRILFEKININKYTGKIDINDLLLLKYLDNDIISSSTIISLNFYIYMNQPSKWLSVAYQSICRLRNTIFLYNNIKRNNCEFTANILIEEDRQFSELQDSIYHQFRFTETSYRTDPNAMFIYKTKVYSTYISNRIFLYRVILRLILNTTTSKNLVSNIKSIIDEEIVDSYAGKKLQLNEKNRPFYENYLERQSKYNRNRRNNSNNYYDEEKIYRYNNNSSNRNYYYDNNNERIMNNYLNVNHKRNRNYFEDDGNGYNNNDDLNQANYINRDYENERYMKKPRINPNNIPPYLPISQKQQSYETSNQYIPNDYKYNEESSKYNVLSDYDNNNNKNINYNNRNRGDNNNSEYNSINPHHSYYDNENIYYNNKMMGNNQMRREMNEDNNLNKQGPSIRSYRMNNDIEEGRSFPDQPLRNNENSQKKQKYWISHLNYMEMTEDEMDDFISSCLFHQISFILKNIMSKGIDFLLTQYIFYARIVVSKLKETNKPHYYDFPSIIALYEIGVIYLSKYVANHGIDNFDDCPITCSSDIEELKNKLKKNGNDYNNWYIGKQYLTNSHRLKIFNIINQEDQYDLDDNSDSDPKENEDGISRNSNSNSNYSNYNSSSIKDEEDNDSSSHFKEFSNIFSRMNNGQEDINQSSLDLCDKILEYIFNMKAKTKYDLTIGKSLIQFIDIYFERIQSLKCNGCKSCMEQRRKMRNDDSFVVNPYSKEIFIEVLKILKYFYNIDEFCPQNCCIYKSHDHINSFLYNNLNHPSYYLFYNKLLSISSYFKEINEYIRSFEYLMDKAKEALDQRKDYFEIDTNLKSGIF